MTKIVEFLKKLQRDERGVSALEYAVLIGIVIGALLLAGDGLGDAISTLFSTATDTLNGGSGDTTGGGT